MLLRQEADERIGGRQTDRAGLRLIEARQKPQQGGLACPVDAHDADDVTRSDGQIELVEEDSMGVPAGEALGHECCAHSAIFPPACRKTLLVTVRTQRRAVER